MFKKPQYFAMASRPVVNFAESRFFLKTAGDSLT